MKKILHKDFLIIAALAIVLTSVFATVTFYEIFKSEVFNNLKISAEMLEREDFINSTPYMDGLRVTIVDEDGNVVFDNKVESSTMGNHADRPEIKEALTTGEGRIIRKSSTLEKNTFYYAMKMENGNVIRTAKEASSMWRLFEGAMPSMATIALALCVFCALLAHFLTRSFVMPVEALAKSGLDDGEMQCPYKELTPFLNTIQKQHEDIIKNARLRQDFTANVSHELKTPLTSISGYAQLMEAGMATEKDVKHFAGEIHRNANRLLNLINDILQLSKLDSAQDVIEKENIDLYQLCQVTAEMLQIQADKHKVRIEVLGEPAMIYANKGMMEEVIYNVCDNGIRYNRQGGKVTVTVKKQDSETLLEIKDTGIGIEQDHLEHVFERFYRVDKSRSKSTGGTGLGLAIVKHIVAEHGARLELDSKPGEGTEVRIYFGLCKQ